VWACGRLDKRELKARRFPAQRSTLNAQRSTPKVHDSRRMSGEVSVTIALLRAMWRSRDGRPDKGEQVVGTGRKTRWFGRRLEFEARSDSHAPPKRGARCR